MENQISLTGTIYKINATEQVTDKFRKRSFILQLAGQYPQHPTIEFVQDKCELLDKYSVGQEVTVAINVNGRLYKDRTTQEEKSFNTIQAWKINAVEGSETPEDTEAGTQNWEMAEATDNQVDDGSDLPF
jgi:hypothetical protein